ncbi:MAG TPA: VIT and VWA domain-containing protein, partial [Polyangiaceae bacterium]
MNFALRWVSGFPRSAITKRVGSWKWASLLLVLILGGPLGCRKAERPLEPRSITWAELRTVRQGVHVTPPGESEREPYFRERLADGTRVRIDTEGLAWLRRDAGATLLVRGPAAFTLRAKSVEVTAGKLFLDSPPDTTTELETPRGNLSLSEVRTSVDVLADGSVRAYVLSGEARAAGARARAGEALTWHPSGAPEITPVRAFDDWTGGLATTDRAAAPAPYGVGTVGARRPGEQGQGAPRFPLAIQRLSVHVTFEGDFAVTEVDQTFFNPSSDTVEGMYGFRTPEGATLARFGVDRDGVVVWGHVKERAAAAQQYQQNVYQGSTEDPALLEWDAPGVYKARLYPIGPGGSRRVVVRYAEWLSRSGPSGERRLYVYPMAAEGAEASLPHIEELTVSFDLEHAGAKEVRAGMTGVREGNALYVRRQDFVPRADLALELYDDGPKTERAYRAKHSPDLDVLPPGDRDAAAEKAKKEADYLLVPLRRELAKRASPGLDLALVVDASAATEPESLAIARAATRALITHLGDNDGLVVWAGDESLRPVVPGQDKPAKVDALLRKNVLAELGQLERGGASDLGAMIASAAEGLDPARERAVVYIGDGQATVGELSLAALRERLGKLTHPVRLFALGVGDGAHLDVLSGLAQGGFAERIADANQAARAALRVLEAAERPAWLDVHVELGPTVERIFPREPSAMVNDETLLVVGRLASSAQPASVKLSGAFGTRELPLEIVASEEQGDLRRRWAEARFAQMLRDGEGRAAMVDLGV